MKKFIIKAMLFTFLLAITTSGIGQTVNTRPGAASDFESNFLIQQNQNVKPNSYMTDLTIEDALQAGGDRLVDMQYTDGSWGWPLTAPPTYGNILGPIAMGLAQAYNYTGDPDHLAALSLSGGYLLTKTNNFSPSDGYLANMLDQVFGVTTYSAHMNSNFYGPLAAGTYNYKGLGTTYSTPSYIQKIHDGRSTIPNLAAWDIGMGLVGASSYGVTGTELDFWIVGVKNEIDLLDGSDSYDVIGLAGAVYGLAFVGEDFNPTSGEHTAASNINDLADILTSYQINLGGFTWNSAWVIPNDDNETIQETAYSILALNEVNNVVYQSEIKGAHNYLLSVQLANGGWKNWTGDGENNEVTAEALWGIAIAIGPKTTIQTPTETSCGLYNVEVTVEDFTNVGAISLILNFDPLVFAYQTPIGVSLNPAISSAFTNVSIPGKFYLGWNEANNNGINLNPGDVLFTLHFNLLQFFAQPTTLSWSTVPGECEYAGPGGLPIYVSSFLDLTWTTPVPSITTCPPNFNIIGCSTGDITGLIYSETTVVVNAADFISAGGVVTYDCAITYYAYQDASSGTCPIIVTRTWTLKDAYDNPFTCDQTITIHHTAPPTEIGGPVSTLSTVECLSQAVAPTLPVVQDYCGVTLTAPVPVITDSPDPLNCEGTRTYVYTYTDCAGMIFVWTYTYTIDITTVPVVPDNGASVVECLASAVPPLAQTYDPLVQTPYPGSDCLFNTYINGVVDQQQPTWNNWVLSYNTGVGQSFTPATSGNLTQIDIDVYQFSGTPGFLLEVYAGNGKVGSPLYSSAGYSISSTGLQSLTIPAALPLVSGTQYTFWLTPYPVNSVWLKIAMGTNPYAGGMAWDEIPTPVIVTDVCGVSIPTPTPVITENPPPITCEGTRIYTYTYTDCSGLSTDWVYTYTIDRTTPPAEVGGPVTSVSNVECIGDAVTPATLPVVEDVCSVVLSPTGPVITDNPDPLTNDGTRTYTYTYTDCANLVFTWSYIYTIADVTNPTITCATPATSYNADPGLCSFTVDGFVAPDVDHFWIAMDGTSTLVPGLSGGIANDPGEDGLWYLYEPDPLVWWWNIWFYNEDYDPNRLKIIRMGFWIKPLDPGLGGYINYVVNWSTDGWVNPGFPMPPDEIFIERSSVNNYILPGPGLEWVELYWVIPDYNPEWVSVDIWGENIWIEQIPMAPPVTSPLYKWWLLNPEPGGIIVHECLPKLPVPGTFLDPVLFDDNCGVASVENDYTHTSTLSGATFPVGTTTVIWTVSDAATPPNTATCSYNIVVVDNQPPTITCAVPVNPYYVNTGCTYVVPGTALDPTATGDNCGVLSVINDFNSSNTLAGAALPVGPTTVVWTITDVAIPPNITTCSYNVVVNHIALSGNLKYHNGGQTLSGVILTLDDGVTPITATTDGVGGYGYNNLCAGTYTLSANFGSKPVGGINATDAAQANYWGTSPWSIEKVRFYAGDAVLNNYVDANDASRILSYFVTAGSIPMAPTWKFWVAGDPISANPTATPGLQIPSVTIGGGDATINLLGQVTGDFNMSYSGASKGASESLLLKEGKNIFAEVGSELELPIVAGMDMDIGAVSLILNFPSDKVEISAVFLTSDPSSPVMYNITGDELRIGWNSLIPAYLDKGESLITLYMKVTNESGEEGISMSLVADPLNELANGNFFVINDAVLIADVIHTSALGIANNVADRLALANHPNPFKGTTNFVYSLPVDGKVILEIYDLVGNKVMTVVDEAQTAGEYTIKLDANRLQPGVYTANLRLSNEDSKLVRTIKILSR